MNRTVNEVKGSKARRALVAGAMGLGLLVSIAGPADAQTSYGGTGTPTTATAGAVEVRPTPAPQVRGATQSRSTLPVTGGDAVGLSVIGAGLVAAGALAVKGARRRTAAAA
jgi:hypothetical protein